METPEIPTQQLFLLATPLQGHSFIYYKELYNASSRDCSQLQRGRITDFECSKIRESTRISVDTPKRHLT